MKKDRIQIFEIVVFSAILLVLVQTFLEDFASLMGWMRTPREILVWTGFAFDLFFTIEFLTRLYWAFTEKRVKQYFFHERGWIDFAASVPLLMLNSGPSVFALVSATASVVMISGILNVLKVLKVVRIARVLRFLRIIKLFRNIKYADSKMTQRHMMRITTLIITTVVIVIFGFSILQNTLLAETHSQTASTVVWRQIVAANNAAHSPAGVRTVLTLYAKTESLVWEISDPTGKAVYSRYSPTEIQERFIKSSDYEHFFDPKTGITAVLDTRPVLYQEAIQNLLFFSLVVILVGVLVFLYSPHFALTVSDPVLIMKNGMKDPHYNLEIKIPALYKDDDVYELAEEYNEVFLPLKDRDLTAGKSEKDAGGLSLKLEDLDFLSDEKNQ
ncbi:MAG: ion transporter [Spirochaetales bacterium]|nr:ion transporter [Spirochaetales bacterium]